jgi:hypothetical protein
MTVSTPGVGRTVVSGLRFFTANDDVNRDPADYKLEGSNNGGLSYALISSNALALPLGRNGAGQALNPITHNVQQVMFANTNSYKSYRLTITRVRNPIPANSMQIGEIEFLGVADTNTSPDISLAAEVRQYLGSPASLAATITGDPIPVNRWQRESGTPGVYTNLTDGGVISGSQTATLTISPADFSHAGNYRIISTNIYGAATNVVSLAVLTTLTDVTAPSDTVTAYGDQSLGFWGAAGNPVNVIDDTFTTYVNGGSGLNAPAGFAPFGGPAGFVVTPALGNTVVNAVRFYTGTDAHINDPADYTLEGSNNGGASYTLISSGAVALPDTRNDVQLGLDPLTSVMREIRFANNQAFTSYRLSHANVKNNATANSVRLGEVELLGAVQPTLTIIDAGGGSLTISSSYPGTLQSATNLTPTVIWANEGPISGSVNISPTPGEPIKFYRVVVP